jgi:hypothetical protein
MTYAIRLEASKRRIVHDIKHSVEAYAQTAQDNTRFKRCFVTKLSDFRHR